MTDILSPERQQAAQNVGAVFGSMTQYLQSLAHESTDGKLVMTESLNEARKCLQVATYWAVQHVAANGLPVRKAPAAPPTEPEKPLELAPEIPLATIEEPTDRRPIARRSRLSGRRLTESRPRADAPLAPRADVTLRKQQHIGGRGKVTRGAREMGE